MRHQEAEKYEFNENGEKIIKSKKRDEDVEEESSSDIADDEDEVEKRMPSVIDLKHGDDKLFAGL
jgi:hypothetical protein